MRRPVLATLVGLGLFLWSAGAAHATLTEVDWQLAGDGLLTRDQATGLEWLDWSHTFNRSYNDVSAKFSAGQEFAGFRYATEAELLTLYSGSAGFPNVPVQDVTDAANIPAAVAFAALFGTTFLNGGRAVYDLVAAEPFTTNGIYGFGPAPYHIVTSYDFASGRLAPRWLNLSDSGPGDFVGHALVRVPEPSPISMLGTSLAAAGLLARRRRRGGPRAPGVQTPETSLH